MNYEKILLMAVFLLSINLVISNCAAIGISPSRVTIFFEPGLQETRQFEIVNNGDEEIYVEIYKKGDLADHITLQEESSTIEAGERKSFTYDIELPDSLEGYGVFDTRIGAVESAPEGSMMGGRAAVESQIWVKKLYEGKYAEVELTLSSVYVGDLMRFVFKVSNFGTETIDCTCTLDILNPAGEKIKTIDICDISLESDTSEKFYPEWITEGFGVGTYKTIAVVSYEEEVLDEKTFNLISKSGEAPVDTVADDGSSERGLVIDSPSMGGFDINLILLIVFIIVGLTAAVLYFTKIRGKKGTQTPQEVA